MPMSATLLAVRTSVHSCANRLKPVRHSMAMSASLGIHPLHHKILHMLGWFRAEADRASRRNRSRVA